MAKKYEKIGQADLYREKKQNSGCAPIIAGAVLLFIIIALLNECSL